LYWKGSKHTWPHGVVPGMGCCVGRCVTICPMDALVPDTLYIRVNELVTGTDDFFLVSFWLLVIQVVTSYMNCL
jgi:hypothetical protein